MQDFRTVPGIGDEFADASEQAAFLVERGYYHSNEQALQALAQHELSSEGREELFLYEDDSHDH